MNNFFEKWNSVENIGQIAEMVEKSFEKPVVIFKYSLSCGVTYSAMDSLEEKWNFESGDLHLYTVDVVGSRNLSMEISKTFSIIHQSPQLLVIRDGKCVKDMSHFRIDPKLIHPFLNTLNQTN
ncbi:MAG: bacillithiol system redox-active protein YtxJ [Cyclobacteriaceae bacterium]|nr:bacillithiol system redox-active protein YtxJ [Cyclobacteriaceae bacterium]MDH5382877.1 bacillithiol system redox-active protein YtxJ [Cyclobacteriaceae bacterium]